jgi:hypothetical protein
MRLLNDISFPFLLPWAIIPWIGWFCALLGNFLGKTNPSYYRRVLFWSVTSFGMVALSWFVLSVYSGTYGWTLMYFPSGESMRIPVIFSPTVSFFSLFPAAMLYLAARKSGQVVIALGILGCINLMNWAYLLKLDFIFFAFFLILLLIARPFFLIQRNGDKPHSSWLNKLRFSSILFLWTTVCYIKFFPNNLVLLKLLDQNLKMIVLLSTALFLPWPIKNGFHRLSTAPILKKVLSVLIFCSGVSMHYGIDYYLLKVNIRSLSQRMGVPTQ